MHLILLNYLNFVLAMPIFARMTSGIPYRVLSMALNSKKCVRSIHKGTFLMHTVEPALELILFLDLIRQNVSWIIWQHFKAVFIAWLYLLTSKAICHVIRSLVCKFCGISSGAQILKMLKWYKLWFPRHHLFYIFFYNYLSHYSNFVLSSCPQMLTTKCQQNNSF